MKTPALCLTLALLATSARGENISLWLTLDEKTIGPAVAWDGSARVSDGGKVAVREWLFDESDSIKDATWQASTQHDKDTAEQAAARGKRAPVSEYGVPKERFAQGRPPRRSTLGKGLLLDVSGPPSGTLNITTKLGDINITLADIAKRRDMNFLDGRMRLRCLPDVQSLTSGREAEEEFPSIAVLPDGRAAVAYVAWDGKKDRIWLRVADKAEALTGAGDFHDPRVAVNGRGELWCVWAANDGKQWDLWARTPGKPAIRLTRSPQNDFWPRLARDKRGDLWLAWQAVADDLHYEVMLAQLGSDGLSTPINVSEHAADDWEPAICAAPDGRIVVAWDTYRNGSFDIYLREFRDGKPLGPAMPVAASAEREAHASVAADSKGRVWITWDVSMAEWGKHPTPTGTLHAWRRSEVACLENGRLARPAQPLMDALPVLGARWIEYPAVAVDGRDRVWVIYRFANDVHPVAPPAKRGGSAQTHTMWILFAHCYDGDKWSRPVLLSQSNGRQDMRFDTALDRDGNLLVVFAGDNRTRQRPAMPVDHDVFVASLRGFGAEPRPPQFMTRRGDTPVAPAESAAGVPPLLETAAGTDLGKITPVAADPEQKPLPREWTVGGKTYKLLVGDTHRHTDISQCSNGGDGSLQDAYRYALDCYRLDWLAISDHDQDILKHRTDRIARPRQDYAWWRSQKYCDLYTIPGRFLALYGYEHGGSYADRGGHKNVVLPVRGQPVREEDSPEEFFKVLANSGCIAIPHQLADAGSRMDWDKWNKDYERVAEIFQMRGNYEFAECPRAARIMTPGNFMWDALAKGVRIGIIASSDHGQTHIALAGAWATDFTRPAILEALRARRTFGGTTKISIETRIGDRPQGSEIELTAAPKIEARLEAPSPIALVQIVRDGQFIYTSRPEQPAVTLSFTDPGLKPGQSAYYYVRAQVGSNDLAWTSPIWVSRK
ncbi:MAG: hypothetical protein HZA91_12355 [Verrucomicrobia bacterium]|nr:hypothetical protein [Verrucomicrobiota bacterium]